MLLNCTQSIKTFKKLTPFGDDSNDFFPNSRSKESNIFRNKFETSKRLDGFDSCLVEDIMSLTFEGQFHKPSRS